MPASVFEGRFGMEGNLHAKEGSSIKEASMSLSSRFCLVGLAVILALGACKSSTGSDSSDDNPQSPAAPVTPAGPSGPPVYVVYATSGGSGSIYAYTINLTTGSLTAVPGSPYADANYPSAVVVEPKGKYAYVVNNNSSNVGAYAITASTGALTPIATYATAFSYPNAALVDPAGKFLYVKTGSGITGYKIDAATGKLSSAGSMTPPSGGAFSDLAAASLSSGEYLYATDSIKSVVNAFSINASTGALASAGSWSTDYNAYNSTQPIAIKVTPDQKRAYVASSYRSIVVCFGINASDGSLSQFTPALYQTGTVPNKAAISPDGSTLFVTDESNGLTYWQIDSATGALSSRSGIGVSGTAGEYAYSLAVDPTGGFVFATCKKSGMYVWAIDPSTKALSGVTGSPFDCGTYTSGITAAKLQP